MLPAVTSQLLAKLTLLGMGFDALGGLFLAYDLLGGKSGPLRVIARAVSYVPLFFLGYAILLGLRYAIVASLGMGMLLAVEFHFAATNTGKTPPFRARLMYFGFLRGCALGLAAMTIAGKTFGILFGLLSGIALTAQYYFGFAPTDDFERHARPRFSRHNLFASMLRAVGVCGAGLISGILTSSGHHWLFFGLQLGLGAGMVSTAAGLLSPSIERWIEAVPERRLGVFGLTLVFLGMLMQSAPSWLILFGM